LKTVRAIERGEAKPVPQSSAKASHAPKIFTENCQIDFAQPTAKVHNFIRGLSPHPGAWTVLDGKTLKILKTEKDLRPATYDLRPKPGEFFSDRKSFLKISTLDGFVQVLELQMEGKRRMNVRDFLNGYKL
jgi:methionyl-tRNA formyltransferase